MHGGDYSTNRGKSFTEILLDPCHKIVAAWLDFTGKAIGRTVHPRCGFARRHRFRNADLPTTGRPTGNFRRAHDVTLRRHVHVAADTWNRTLWRASNAARIENLRWGASAATTTTTTTTTATTATYTQAKTKRIPALNEKGSLLAKILFVGTQIDLLFVGFDLTEIRINCGIQREVRGQTILDIGANLLKPIMSVAIGVGERRIVRQGDVFEFGPRRDIRKHFECFSALHVAHTQQMSKSRRPAAFSPRRI